MLQLHGCLDFSINHIDDIIICSKDKDTHVEHIKKVLIALTSVNLTVQPAKCIFFVVKLPVLGFWMEIGGMRPNLNKLCNMLEWQGPNTQKKLQSLLGIIGFFRSFYRNGIPDHVYQSQEI